MVGDPLGVRLREPDLDVGRERELHGRKPTGPACRRSPEALQTDECVDASCCPGCSSPPRARPPGRSSPSADTGRNRPLRRPRRPRRRRSTTPWAWSPRTSSRFRCARPGAPSASRAQRVAYAVTVRTRPSPSARPARGRSRISGGSTSTVCPRSSRSLGARLDRDCHPSWYRVQLPMRPNGSTGWVRASAVAPSGRCTSRIVVDLSQRSVTLYRGLRPVLVTTAAIGSPSTPTPTGRYFVNQKLVAPDPLGPYGPAALGISAFSPVLQDWAQGGPIAIHGTTSRRCSAAPSRTAASASRTTSSSGSGSSCRPARPS